MAQKGTRTAREAKNETSPRASVTFPREVYASLEIIAKQKKVSMAWVIRDAADKYVSEQWPLFAGAKYG
jgi:metal-responsive CopG/Arc/MetJ family transcriptional regulator